MTKELDQLKKIRQKREDEAAQAEMVAQQKLDEATYLKQEADARVREYQDFRKEEEIRLKESLKKRSISLHMIDFVKFKLDEMKDKEIELQKEAMEAEKNVTIAQQNLDQASKAKLEAVYAHMRITESIAYLKEEEVQVAAKADDDRMEESATISWGRRQ